MCNFCSGDDDVHDLIQRLFSIVNHTLIGTNIRTCSKKLKNIGLHRSDPDLSHLQTFITLQYIQTYTDVIYKLWKCRTRHWTRWRKWHIVDKGKQTGGLFLTDKILIHHLHWKLFIFWSKNQRIKTENKETLLLTSPKSMFRNRFKKKDFQPVQIIKRISEGKKKGNRKR